MGRRKNRKGPKPKDPCSTNTNNKIQQSESDLEKSTSVSDTTTDTSSNVGIDTPRNESGDSTPTSIDIKISTSKNSSKMRKLEEETPCTDDTESTSTAQTVFNQTDSEDEWDDRSSKCITKSSNRDKGRSEQNWDQTRDNGRRSCQKFESRDTKKDHNSRRKSQSPRKHSPSNNQSGRDKNKSYSSHENTNRKKNDDPFRYKNRSKSNDRSYSKKSYNHNYSNKSDDRNYGNKSDDRNYGNKSNDHNYGNKSYDCHYGNKNNVRYDVNGYFERTPRDGSNDPDFCHFEHIYMTHKDDMDFKIVNEIFGDLFSASDEYSLGHCVAEDMNMGSGIAVQFRQTFKKVAELLDQRQTQGHVAVLEDKSRYIYYLVTKRVSSGKPTYYTLWSSLQRMKDHIQANNVVKLALPRIGCGLDGLEWKWVKKMLEYVFRDVNIEIKIYNYQQDPDAPPPPKLRKCKVVNYPKELAEIENGTIVIYFGSEDGYETDEITSLSKKFPYIKNHYKMESRMLGRYVQTDKYNDGYNFYGCIVRKRHKDLFNFTSFQNCLKSIQTKNRKEGYNYIAFQAFLEDNSDFIVAKIINLVRHAMTDVDVYVCWPEKLHKYMPRTSE